MHQLESLFHIRLHHAFVSTTFFMDCNDVTNLSIEGKGAKPLEMVSFMARDLRTLTMIHSDGDDSYRKLHNYFYPDPCQVTFAFRGATSDRTWIATVTAGGKSFVSEGKQKKEAKALAARKALDHFEQPQLPPDVMAAEDVAAASPEPQDSS